MGHDEVMWRLIKAGGALGAKGSAGATALVYSAVSHANVKLLELLDEQKILDVEAASHGRVPLIEAVRHGSTAVVEWLLAHGANATAVTPGSGDTPVTVAAMEDRFPLLWKLHAAGAPLDVRNEYGGTVLMSAVHYGHRDDAEKLLAAGLDVNAHNHRGDTCLTLAASRDDLPLVEFLLSKGASAAPVGLRQDTPLHRAARFKRVATAKLLLDRQLVPVDAPNERGITPLHEACRAGHASLVELLLENGASPEKVTKRGMTPLLEAAEGGDLETIKLIVAQPGVDVHAKTPHGDGALELARWGQYSDEIAKVLKAHGAMPAHPDDEHALNHDEEEEYHREIRENGGLD